MKKLLLAALVAAFPSVASAQCTGVFPAGTVCGVPTGGGSGLPFAVSISAYGLGLNVGSTTITGGSSGNVLYDNAGVLGEYTTTGTGTTVALQTTPTFNFGTGALSSIQFTSANTGFINQLISFNTGTASNSGTAAEVLVELNCANCYSVYGTVGGASPVAILQTGAGITAGLSLSTAAGQIGLNGATGVSITGNATGINLTGPIGGTALATAAQYLAGVSTTTIIPPNVIYQSETTTTYGTTTSFDFSTFINTAVTLTGGNITTMNVSNVTAGKAGTITFIQDGSGSRTTVWNTVFKFAGGAAPALSTAANAVDVLSYSCRSATFCVASLLKQVQ